MLTNLKDRLFRRRAAADAKVADAKAGKPAFQPVHLSTAKNIVVLFPADDAADRKAIDKWRETYKMSGGKIKFTGYFSQNIGSTDFGFPAITPKNLNWYGVPKGESVNAFNKLECDLLLRLGPVEHKELDYLAASKATNLKVGPFQPEVAGTPYHLQFDAKGASGLRDQLAAIEQIFSYTNANRTT
jgi:hypothetical protein